MRRVRGRRVVSRPTTIFRAIVAQAHIFYFLRSLKTAYYLRKERRLEEEEEHLVPGERRSFNPTSADLQPPASRHPSLRSPNLSLSSSHDSTTTLASILPAMQETSARFTQKFPWAARNGVNGGKGVRLSDDGAAVDAMGVSLLVPVGRVPAAFQIPNALSCIRTTNSEAFIGL